MTNSLAKKSSCGCDCCGKRVTGFRVVKIGSCRVEIVGVDDVFQKHFDNDRQQVDALDDELIKNAELAKFHSR